MDGFDSSLRYGVFQAKGQGLEDYWYWWILEQARMGMLEYG